jgi:hypothetical protein
MKIEGEIADPRAVSAWKAVLACASAERILDYVERSPDLQAGFRPGRMSHKVAVGRIKGLLDHGGEMPARLRNLLSSTGLDGALLTVLSDDAIGAAEKHLGDYFGCDELYSAMLLSDREGVRSLGTAGFAQETFPQPTDEEKEAALAALNELFRPVFDILGCSAAVNEVAFPVTVANEPRGDVEADKKYSQMKSERDKQSRESIRLSKELDQKQAELLKAVGGQKAIEANLEAVRVLLATEKTAHQTLAQAFEQAVADEAQRRCDARVLPWLEPAEDLAAAAAIIGSDNILHQAEALLSRQEQSDRRYGLWSQLARERDNCLAMIERLSRAKQESIRPLPKIGTTTDLLVARVAELEQLLGHGTPTFKPHFAPQELFKLAQEAATLEELAALRADLEASNRIGFLHEAALAEAYRLIQEACWKLYSTQPESKAGQKDDGWQNMLPLHALQRSLRQGESCLLLIDGHNVLFRLRSILQLDFEGNSPGSRARKQLIDKVSALAVKFQCIDIHLWYDGQDAHDIAISRNLVVHYSGGLGRNRADEEIVKYLQSIDYMRAKQQSRLKVLVSADKGLSDAARPQGAAMVLAPEELAILLTLPNR